VRLQIQRVRLWRYPAAAGIVLLSALLVALLYRVFDITGLSMVFLAGVLISAVALGSGPGYFSALFAFVLYNYYLSEPRFTLAMARPEDYLVLGVFLGVAVLTGGLAGRLRDEARRNKLRARATAALFEASRGLSSTPHADAIRQQLVEHIAMAARGEARLTDGGQTWFHPAPLNAAEAAESWRPEEGWRAQPVTAEGVDLGLAGWRNPGDERIDPERDRLISVLIDLGAAAILRARSSTVQADLVATARTEQLRTALLSSISHDLRTPLAAILASATSLKTFGDQFTPEVCADLIATIEEEAERLNRFVGNLLSMTRLESGALSLERQTFDAAEVINRAVGRIERRRHRPVERAGLAPVAAEGDPILLEQALDNVLENAARYSPPAGAICVRCVRRADRLEIDIDDEGPGVPDDDLERIFDKFYRSPASSGASQGTGLGLSIARGLLEAMNGDILAQNKPDGGLNIRLRIPVSEHV
jgi:two-component system sensor histidine kinase KdpD